MTPPFFAFQNLFCLQFTGCRFRNDAIPAAVRTGGRIRMAVLATGTLRNGGAPGKKRAGKEKTPAANLRTMDGFAAGQQSYVFLQSGPALPDPRRA